jgi:hypothetical protein
MFQTFTPIQYLKIDIANSFGLDKLSWDKRLNWFDQNESNLSTMLDTAKEPALFYAGIKAYYAALKGEPIGYMISLDATASGLQILAALTGDRQAAQLCNVVDTGDRRNAYEIVYDEMCHRIGDTSKISPDDAKQAIMTSLYGSTAVPKQVFGEGDLLKIFYQTMKDLAPAAWELNEAFLEIWDNDAMENNWVLPDNFHVNIKVMNQVKQTVHFLNEPFDVFYNINAPISNGRSLGANITHSIDGLIVREMTRRCDHDPKVVEALRLILDKGNTHGTRLVTEDDKMVIVLWNHFKQTGYLSARIINYLNSDNIGHVRPKVISDLLDTFPDKPFKVISIHDCFRSLPNYGNDLRLQYNVQLEMIAKSELLTNLFCQILGRDVKIGKLDPTLYKNIRETNYGLS